MSFESLGLAPALLRALAEQGYAEPTPIQAAAIPVVLEGGDLLAAAQTGTGKTAAFSLPLLQHLSTAGATQTRRPRALVLTPTRELAAQVHDNLRDYGKHLRISSTTIFGGVSMGPQMQALRRGVDIVIATPGRLIDHMQQRSIDLSGVEVLVLDEADRMLDMGFLPALKRILAAVPRQRQTLLFSATFAPPIKALAMQFMHQPREVSVTPANSVATTVTHHVHPVDASKKRDCCCTCFRRTAVARPWCSAAPSMAPTSW
jgi:ATP-dependent RNA helicase RhlE